MNEQAHSSRWTTCRRCWVRAAVALVVLTSVAVTAVAATEYEKRAGGLAVYMGVLPAELLRGGAEHLTSMHRGLPSGSGSHHVIISVFDEGSGRQIDDATVLAGSRRWGCRNVAYWSR
jgi:hypothetical protein